jgi:hypothetical protein
MRSCKSNLSSGVLLAFELDPLDLDEALDLVQGFVDGLKSRHRGHLVLLDAKKGFQCRPRASVVRIE